MGTVAHPALGGRSAVEHDLRAAFSRSERSMALIRLGVTAAVMAVYFNSLGIRRSLGPTAVVILALAAVYSIACLLFLGDGESRTYRVRMATVLVDVLLVTWWVQATGGRHSEFWTLYLIVIVGAALRFRLFETLGVAIGVTALHLSLAMGSAGTLSRSQLILRPTVFFATSFAVGVLAYQRGEHRRERSTLEAIADHRAQELGQERAEVERLRRVDIRRSEFVAIAAHEFRTPLAAIIGVLSTMKVHGDVLEPAVRQELLDGASAQADRLARLVDDLLTVSRIDDGVLRLDREEADVRDLLVEAERASGTTGRVHVELHRVDRVLCDVDAIVRVLTNLLDNARKYAPESSPIEVAVRQADDRVTFAVRDRGPGIAAEDRDAIFERFRQLGDGRTKGAGLGLYICRGLVEAHGGSIQVGDALDGGAVFTFDLPVAGASTRVTEVTEPAIRLG